MNAISGYGQNIQYLSYTSNANQTSQSDFSTQLANINEDKGSVKEQNTIAQTDANSAKSAALQSQLTAMLLEMMTSQSKLSADASGSLTKQQSPNQIQSATQQNATKSYNATSSGYGNLQGLGISISA